MHTSFRVGNDGINIGNSDLLFCPNEFPDRPFNWKDEERGVQLFMKPTRIESCKAAISAAWKFNHPELDRIATTAQEELKFWGTIN